MERSYSISVSLNGEALDKVYQCHEVLKNTFSIRFMSDKPIQPHINIISGQSSKIEAIISKLKKFKSTYKYSTNIIGLGILLTPAPLIYLRFTNSNLLQDLRKYVYQNTSTMWTEFHETTNENFWIPKSTIAFGDVSIQQISDVAESLSFIKFQCKMSVEELCIMECSEQEREIASIMLQS
ncbi:hypothetical protein OAD39_01485 [Gammaproteobacteria bacterium]|jgi:hypothetical protein|nr:hypothetical protein [Gammaproteobacteria bacterium]